MADYTETDPHVLAVIGRVAEKDPNALAEFIEIRRVQLLAYIDRNLGPALRRKVEADDLFQEVSVECVRSLNAVDLTDRDPFPWLCQVAQRKIIDSHRRFFAASKRDASKEMALGQGGGETGSPGLINMLVASITSPSAAFSRQGKEIRMQQAISELPEESRQAIQMRYVEGLATKEISERLGKSDVSVRVLLSRTIKKLEKLLTDGSEDE